MFMVDRVAGCGLVGRGEASNKANGLGGNAWSIYLYGQEKGDAA